MHPRTPPSPLTDDDVRWLMVRTAASLARLWARLKAFRASGKQPPNVTLCARHIDPPEPWLDVIDGGVALSGVIEAVLLAEGLLLHDATSPSPPDRRRFCLIVQHINCSSSSWSSATLRLAERLGVVLTASVHEETHRTTMPCEIYRLDGTYDRNSKASTSSGP